MKTSNKIFVGLLTLVLLLVVGSNLVLKAGYDKINFSDPFHGFAQGQTPAFKAVRIEGNFPGSVRLQPGSGFEVRTAQRGAQDVQWELSGDTLVLQYHDPRASELNRQAVQISLEQALGYPFVYVLSPTLSAVQSQSVTVLSGWQEAEMTVAVTGRHLILDRNRIGRLSIRTGQACATHLKPSNQIESVSVTLQDSSSLQVKKDVFTSVRLQASPQASVNVPVSVLQKIMQEQEQP